MTSKNLFFKLMKENAKRRLWVIAISILTFFFSFPVAMAMICGEYQSYELNADLAYQDMVENATNLLTNENGFVVAIIIMASVLCAVSSFSYLHAKRKVDFFHSLPVRRETYFWVTYVNGILIVAIPYLVSVLLAAVVMGMNGMNAGAVLAEAVTTFLFHMLHFILLYAAASVAMMMTGNIVIGIMGNLVFWGYIPIVTLLFTALCEMFFRTYYGGNWNEMILTLSRFSPFSEYIYGYSQWYQGEISAGVMAVTVFAAAAITLLALKLYQLRPSEAAGKAMAFQKTQTIIKILIVIPSAIAGMMFFYVMRDSDAWGIFGMICGLLLSYCLIEIIYNFDFRKMFSHKMHLGFCGVAAVCIISIFRFDLIGYDTYLPKQENVESGSMYISSMDDWIDYSTQELYEYGGGRLSIKFHYKSSVEHVFQNMNLTDVENMLKVAEEGIAQLNLLERNQYHMNSIENEEENFYTRVYIQYHLKNGKNPVRSYYLDLSKILGTVDQIYKSEGYKKGTFPLLSQSPDEIAGINYQECGEVMHVDLKNGDNSKKELMEAYQEDLTGLSLETRKGENPICLVQFKTNEMQAMIDALKRADNGEWTRFNDIDFYPVYPSFTKTIALLKENGIEAGNQYLSDQKIAKIVLRRNYAYEASSEMENREEEITIIDREQIKELKSVLVWDNYAYLNTLRPMNYKVNVNIFLDNSVINSKEDRTYDIGFSLPYDNIPDFLDRKISAWK